MTGIVIEACEKRQEDKKQKWKIMTDSCDLLIVSREEVSILQATQDKHRSTHT